MATNNDYALRISNATPNELNIIIFELCILNINEALEAVENNKKVFEQKINTAISILREIVVSLNFEYQISYELSEIYLYTNKLLISSRMNFNTQNLIDAVTLLTTIKEGFEQINDKGSDSVMANTSKVFAGLTYGRNGDLSEYIDESQSRGFKA